MTSASGSPLWFWASLLALLVIALITAAVVIAATKDDEKNAGSTSSTLPATVVPTGLTTVPIPPTTLSTVPTLPTTTTFPTTTTAPITTTGPTTDASGLTVWPAGKSGYTIILESVPESSGKSAAETKAKSAQSKGLSQVGSCVRPTTRSSHRAITPSSARRGGHPGRSRGRDLPGEVRRVFGGLCAPDRAQVAPDPGTFVATPIWLGLACTGAPQSLLNTKSTFVCNALK